MQYNFVIKLEKAIDTSIFLILEINNLGANSRGMLPKKIF